MIQERLVHGRKVSAIEPLGGVFAPIPGQPIRVVYSYGHPESKTKTPMFQCPVSAIPGEVWELLALWYSCHALGVLPYGGGFLDQPLIVRRAFPIFATEWRTVEAQRQASGGGQAAAMAAGLALKAVFGGK